jgi:endonuclease YncB( thermonuclease family)
MNVLPIRKPNRRRRGLERPAWRTGLDWIVVAALFGICGLLIVRLDQVQTRALGGIFSVVDGDTITLGGEKVRLRGIDAFEGDQLCRRAGTEYRCGAEARAALANMTAGRRLSCAGRTFDRYGRLLAVCTAGGSDLNAAMVEAGWAVAYGDYEAEERRARNAKRGAWAGTFDQPADWRAARGGPVEERQDLVQWLLDILRQIIWGRTI